MLYSIIEDITADAYETGNKQILAAISDMEANTAYSRYDRIAKSSEFSDRLATYVMLDIWMKPSLSVSPFAAKYTEAMNELFTDFFGGTETNKTINDIRARAFESATSRFRDGDYTPYTREEEDRIVIGYLTECIGSLMTEMNDMSNVLGPTSPAVLEISQKIDELQTQLENYKNGEPLKKSDGGWGMLIFFGLVVLAIILYLIFGGKKPLPAETVYLPEEALGGVRSYPTGGPPYGYRRMEGAGRPKEGPPPQESNEEESNKMGGLMEGMESMLTD